MKETIFNRWRVALLFLFLSTELLWISQRNIEWTVIGLTLALAPLVWHPISGKKRWLLSFVPAIWLFFLCVLRLATLFSARALTALHPVLCGTAFILAVLQFVRHGKITLYQWSYPVAWIFGAGCLLALLLGWPRAEDLWFLLLVLVAEFARCAALLHLLQ